MSTSKERESFAGYQQAAGKMAAFTSAANRPEISQLSEEQTRMLLDACDHSKSSYAEEVLVQDLHKLQEQFEEHERKNEADKRDQAKEKTGKPLDECSSLVLGIRLRILRRCGSYLTIAKRMTVKATPSAKPLRYAESRVISWQLKSDGAQLENRSVQPGFLLSFMWFTS